MALKTLTITTGRFWAEGRILFGGFSLPTARLEVRKQAYGWLLLRNKNYLASSMRLSVPPTMLLWNAIRLPFRCVGGCGSTVREVFGNCLQTMC